MSNSLTNKQQTVLVYDKDEIGRWLLGTYLSLQTERNLYTKETAEISQVRIAIERGEADLVIISIHTVEDLQYWIDSITEQPRSPLLFLIDNTNEYIEQKLQERTVTYINKNQLSRDALSQAIETTLKRWEKARQNAIHQDEFDKIANYDSLTGVLNRRAILNKLEECIAQARRYNTALSILLLDIDHFQSITENFGQRSADIVMFRVAVTVDNKTRDTDFVGRYGRDELLVIFTHTSIDAAGIVGERLRKMVETLDIDIEQDKPYRVTVSGGLATYEAGDDFATLSYKAESALCNAKYNGRNRIEKS